jgi:hypothetical protein
MDRNLSVVNRMVQDKTVGGYEVYYNVDEGDEGREKSMGCFREMRVVMGVVLDTKQARLW